MNPLQWLTNWIASWLADVLRGIFDFTGGILDLFKAVGDFFRVLGDYMLVFSRLFNGNDFGSVLNKLVSWLPIECYFVVMSFVAVAIVFRVIGR